MSLIRSLLIIRKIHEYISKKASGDRAKFARKIGISSSSLNRHLREMKMLGYPIAFDKIRDTYYYAEERVPVADLVINLDRLNVLGKNEMRCCNDRQYTDVGSSLYYLCVDPETGKRNKSENPC